MSFLKGFFSSCLGALTALIIFLLGGIFFFVAISSADQVMISPNSVLQLRLAAPISELEVEDDLEQLFPEIADARTGLIQMKNTIRYAKTDANIQGIYLNVSQIPAGISTLAEIRNSILDFRESGKWVIAYSDAYSEGAYYLASAADKVYLNPHGMVEFNGLAIEVTFYKKMFDKLEIKPEVFRVGDFKSAVEPYLRESMSDENRLQLNSMITSIHGQLLNEVSTSRSIERNRLQEISDKMMVRNASQAVELGLVDSLYYDDQVKNEMRTRLGLKKDASVSVVKYADYRRSLPEEGKTSDNQIAVIVADGNILPGNSTAGVVGGNTIMNEVRKARKSKRVKAIVLRVNSPGGSFHAADQMWRELTLAAQEKPVIASMSDYAASGGYYIAMACDTIVAQPTTITGSIGIFSVLFDLSGFLNNKIGVTTEEVKTGEVGELITFMRPLSELEKSIWQNQTDEIYEIFTGKAAAGRKMNINDLKKIASGRVWTGEQAKANGLVDVLGGFEDAVNIAAQEAGVKDYQLTYFPEPKSFLERLTEDVDQNLKVRAMHQELGELYPWYQQWKKVKDFNGVQARMPFDFQLR
jgi:signal peptide peptidase SppA, 67K type